MRKILRTLLALTALMFLMSGISAAPTQWKQLAPGLQYTRLQPNLYGHLYAFRIDPTQYDLSLAFARDQNNTHAFGASVAQLAKQSEALVAINSGFFTPNYQPLGLRIQNGLVRNSLKNISWWGVFYLRNHQPFIAAQKNYKIQPGTDFAVQAGPRLVVNGHIPTIKNGGDDRTALCITKNKQIILMVSQGNDLSMHDFAVLISLPEHQGGLACYNALNLDGGHSSQLYARVNQFRLSVTNLSPIADAVIVRPRNLRAEAASTQIDKIVHKAYEEI